MGMTVSLASSMARSGRIKEWPVVPAAKSIRRALFLIIPALLLAAWVIWRQLQGPERPGYRLETRPLVQRVVASGEVDSQSLAQVGSEITGVVAVRHVREGDAVKAGDLLLELRDDEQRARLREAEAALQQLIDSTRPQAQATLREAENNLEQADRERQRRETLFERKLLASEPLEQARRAALTARVVRDRARFAASAVAEGGSEEQVLRQRLEAARANLAKTRIHAQVDGIVQTREVEPGDLVQPGRILLTIARAGSSEIRCPWTKRTWRRSNWARPPGSSPMPTRIACCRPASVSSRQAWTLPAGPSMFISTCSSPPTSCVRA